MQSDTHEPNLFPTEKTYRRRQTLKRIALILASILLVTLLLPFCSIFLLVQGNPEPLQADFTPSDEDANAFEHAYDDVVQNANELNEPFRISFTNEQFASWLNRRYNEATDDEINRIEMPAPISSLAFNELKNIQVAFEPGLLRLYAETEIAGGTILALALEAELSINEKGRLDVEVTKAQMGSLKMSDEIRRELASPIQNALIQRLLLEGDYVLDQVELTEGILVLIGHVIAIKS